MPLEGYPRTVIKNKPKYNQQKTYCLIKMRSIQINIKIHLSRNVCTTLWFIMVPLNVQKESINDILCEDWVKNPQKKNPPCGGVGSPYWSLLTPWNPVAYCLLGLFVNGFTRRGFSGCPEHPTCY